MRIIISYAQAFNWLRDPHNNHGLCASKIFIKSFWHVVDFIKYTLTRIKLLEENIIILYDDVILSPTTNELLNIKLLFTLDLENKSHYLT